MNNNLNNTSNHTHGNLGEHFRAIQEAFPENVTENGIDFSRNQSAISGISLTLARAADSSEDLTGRLEEKRIAQESKAKSCEKNPAKKEMWRKIGAAALGAGILVAAGFALDQDGRAREAENETNFAKVVESAVTVKNIDGITITPHIDSDGTMTPVQVRTDPGIPYIGGEVEFLGSNSVGEVAKEITISSDVALRAENKLIADDYGDNGNWIGIPVDSISILEADQPGFKLNQKKVVNDPDGIVWISSRYAAIDEK